MRYLRLGSEGDDVLAWEVFLRGLRPCSELVVDGKYDPDTFEETKIFQRAMGLVGDDVDGVVGNQTYGFAASLGFKLAEDDDARDDDDLSPAWPAKPADLKALPFVDRVNTFGKFSYISTPVNGNPEAITITDGWAKENIVSVEVPQLKGVLYAPALNKVQFHKVAAPQLQALFQAWEDAGLKKKILTWGGTWVPRYIRGSKTVLSNHAWGTAFDINVQWNMLGTVPALKDKKGSVRELVTIAAQFGFFWGGWFTRQDGMHFEIAHIVK